MATCQQTLHPNRRMVWIHPDRFRSGQQRVEDEIGFESGEVRTDLSLEQILDMVIALATIDGGPDYTGPILRAALAGLRPGT